MMIWQGHFWLYFALVAAVCGCGPRASDYARRANTELVAAKSSVDTIVVATTNAREALAIGDLASVDARLVEIHGAADVANKHLDAAMSYVVKAEKKAVKTEAKADKWNRLVAALWVIGIGAVVALGAFAYLRKWSLIMTPLSLIGFGRKAK